MLIAFGDADSAAGVVDLHLVVVLPAGVEITVDVGLAVAVVFILFDGGGQHAAHLLLLARDSKEGGKCRNC